MVSGKLHSFLLYSSKNLLWLCQIYTNLPVMVSGELHSFLLESSKNLLWLYQINTNYTVKVSGEESGELHSHLCTVARTFNGSTRSTQTNQ